MSRAVYTELDTATELPIRVFRTKSDALLSNFPVAIWPKAKAVKSIRGQVFKRSGGECEKCGARVTWETAEMDERIPKGKQGEVSVQNSWILCYDCHQGPLGQHKDRRWQSAKKD